MATAHTENVVPFLTPREKQVTILIVEDDDLALDYLQARVQELGYKILTANNGKEALDVLGKNKNAIDVVLMDRLMPVMDGIAAVLRMKEDTALRRVPVVMLTGAGSTQDVQDGIKAGVFYYLTKPVDDNILRSILIGAAREAKQNKTIGEEMNRYRAGFNLIHTCKFEFRTLDEAEQLAAFVARCFPDPERALPGILHLLVNAVEHGILQIGYEKKSELLENQIWRAEIERRQTMDHYKTRKANAVITRKEEGIYIVVTDEGEGFVWQSYMSIDPARAGDNHGRGIAQARASSFDKLTFNEKGNQAIGFVGREMRLDW